MGIFQLRRIKNKKTNPNITLWIMGFSTNQSLKKINQNLSSRSEYSVVSDHAHVVCSF